MNYRPNRMIDISGNRFGELTAIQFKERRNGITYWICECGCGNKKEFQLNHLRNGHTKSCGCSMYKAKNIIHGLRQTDLYRVWSAIKTRCNNPKAINYKNYGGKGIQMCVDWQNDVSLFYDWCITNGYKEGLEIDRINNNGNYEPSNCRFVTKIENRRNRDCVKLSLGDALDIRRKYSEGFSAKVLSKTYNVSMSSIWRVVSHKIWA